ncbi:MAG: hypothetical protein ABI361_09815 [Nitrososphaera sp.]
MNQGEQQSKSMNELLSSLNQIVQELGSALNTQGGMEASAGFQQGNSQQSGREQQNQQHERFQR